jgi:hypothetical protein
MANIQPEVLKTLKSDILTKVNQGNKRTHSFYADFTEVNPKFIRSKFTVHYPSQLEKLQIGVTKSSLLGGNLNVDTMTDNIAHIISTLDTVVDVKPDWFDVGDPDLDYDIMEAVFYEYMEWVNSFRKPTKPSANEGDSPDGGGTLPVVGAENVPDSTN